MSLLAPLGLLALLSLPVILLLHMLRERRRRVVVPSLLLWQGLPQPQEAQRRRRLPLTLLLLLHLLAALLMALALAQPHWRFALFGQAGHLAIVLDTSTSMAAPASNFGGSRLDAAREEARRLISSPTAPTRITLIEAGPQARLLDTADPESMPRLMMALDELQAGGTGTDLAGALTLAEAALQGFPEARVVVLTDAALAETQAASLADHATSVPVDWVTVGGPRENRALVTLTARPRSNNGPVQVYARVVNYGNEPERTILRLFGDDQLLDAQVITLRPRGETELTWTVPRGLAILRAELDGNDDLPIDDVATLSLNQTRPVAVTIVSAQPETLQRALRAVPRLTVSTVSPTSYGRTLATVEPDLTIFDGFLPATWPAGGVLVINPPAGTPLLEVSTQQRQPVPGQLALRVTAAQPTLFEGVSLDSVEFGPVAVIQPHAWATALLLRGDQPLMLRGRTGTSEIAVWAFDLERGNLTSRVAFPLLLTRTVRDLTPPALPGAILAGESLVIAPDPRTTRIELGRPDGSAEVFMVGPGATQALDLALPGVYTLQEYANQQLLYTGQLAVNAGAPAESDLTPRVLPASVAPGLDPMLIEDETGQPLWPWLLGLVLVVLLFEWIYVHNRRRTPGESTA
ncbi:VWA domain-containing protein [Candidatus Chloroploca sp. M-50]|uniref:VWA domain-containing protein n=1 Tax=Candidatus Chloroploca mongolica TaxID=2528176 RepID=A0ABS4DAN2_9CHLR|nr:VWA domain-containing protein [Candidatus Chloroploca mongolica]MBP1466492.1 VWA domain-containing protein [Candidatus Chloroploca mongolica]